MLKLATWNVNSLKVRFDQVLQWTKDNDIDILAVQETKLSDELFPEAMFRKHGFDVVFSGQKTYNGVAIISRYGITEPLTDIDSLQDPQRRILAATIAGIRLINLYVPNGSEVGSAKFNYKLDWLDKVTAFIKEELIRYPQLIVAGDFNIAPDDRDVHNPQEWLGCVHVSEPERQAFSALLDLGLYDSFRNFEQLPQLFSWWDYRAAGFRRNRGLRIDHILLNDNLMNACKKSSIDIEPRRAERPSDHAPVWVELDLCLNDHIN
ncbi:MAG: exodeoxyribonuclease III [Legionella sp.]